MERAKKIETVTSLNEEVFSSAESMVVVHYRGLSVDEITDLRQKSTASGAKTKVTKNSLVRRAIEGTKFSNIVELFSGPTAIVYSDDAVAAAKVAVDYAKDNEKLVIIGGALGEEALDEQGIKSLASMPSLDESRAKLIGILTTPATRLASVAQAPAGQLARLTQAYASSE